MSKKDNNVICLQEYRRRVFPSPEEIEFELKRSAVESSSLDEADIALVLLEMHEKGQIKARRSPSGEFLYSLAKEEQGDALPATLEQLVLD
jgi:hypothetical protein